LSQRIRLPTSEPAHQAAHQWQLFIQLPGGIPVVAVKFNQPASIEFQLRAAANGLQPGPVKAFEAKLKIPGQKTLRAVNDAAGHHEAGLLQRCIHVAENLPDAGNATHFIERVLEAGLRRVKRIKPVQAGRRQGFEEIDHARRCNAHRQLRGQ